MAGVFFAKYFWTYWPPGAIKKKEKTHTSYTHTATVWPTFRFGTGDIVVAGIGIADGSRAKYDVGV